MSFVSIEMLVVDIKFLLIGAIGAQLTCDPAFIAVVFPLAETMSAATSTRQ